MTQHPDPRDRRAAVAVTRQRVVATLVLTVLAACAPGSSEGPLPPNVPDPASVKTAVGALTFYRKVLTDVPGVLQGLVFHTGIMTDELAALPLRLLETGVYTAVDSRQDFSELTAYSDQLHRLRAQAREARGFLESYVPDSSGPLRAHLYAVEAFADIWLADLFCSGIPLSTVDYNGDYTLAPGSNTSEVYQRAVGLFDSALALAGDSVGVRQFAAVGRGRALLALGSYDSAAATVAAVPTSYKYQAITHNHGFSWPLLAATDLSGTGNLTVGQREGVNGLDYRSSGDPRVPILDLGADRGGYETYWPAKYSSTDLDPTLTVADGIEARLIEAEAGLNAGSDTWLTILNALRSDGTYDTQPNPDDPGITDTLWHAGAGGVPGLKPLDDPGGVDARVDLLFRERAFWLYLTAHREGDLRRRLRQYPGLIPDQLYPTGAYWGGTGVYGSEIVVPVPQSEQQLNPKYTGCFHHGA